MKLQTFGCLGVIWRVFTGLDKSPSSASILLGGRGTLAVIAGPGWWAVLLAVIAGPREWGRGPAVIAGPRGWGQCGALRPTYMHGHAIQAVPVTFCYSWVCPID